MFTKKNIAQQGFLCMAAILSLRLSLVNRRFRITDFAPKSKSHSECLVNTNFQSLSLKSKSESLFET